MTNTNIVRVTSSGQHLSLSKLGAAMRFQGQALPATIRVTRLGQPRSQKRLSCVWGQLPDDSMILGKDKRFISSIALTGTEHCRSVNDKEQVTVA
jgi:hypothetical protein